MEWSDTDTTGFSSWVGRLLAKEQKDDRDLNRASRELLKGTLGHAAKKYVKND